MKDLGLCMRAMAKFRNASIANFGSDPCLAALDFRPKIVSLGYEGEPTRSSVGKGQGDVCPHHLEILIRGVHAG